jgi:hypothetical protein
MRMCASHKGMKDVPISAQGLPSGWFIRRPSGGQACRKPLGRETCRRAHVESLGAERPPGRTTRGTN